MNLPIFKFFERLYFSFSYHQLEQFLNRFLVKLYAPFKHPYFLFKHSLNYRPKLILRQPLPTLIDFPEQLLPLLKTSSKYHSSLSQAINLESLSLLEQFEHHSHRNLISPVLKQDRWNYVFDWIQRFPLSDKKSYKISWHPYVTSKRIQSWSALWLMAPPQNEIRKIILDSFFIHILWLKANLEKDIKGNHLWENGQALILGGSLFEGAMANRWLTQGLNILKSCIKTQLLDSGEHFEKSPSYHLELANGLSFLLPWLKLSAPEEVIFFKTQSEKMLDFATKIAHPSGKLPFFNDSWEMHLSPSTLSIHDWVGDYFVSRKSNSFFVFDAGNLGEDSLPAHAHCDLLTFEMSFKDSPLIINSGTFCYQGDKRNEYRQSKSHNVMLVNDKNSADIWSSFRMGRRGHILKRNFEKSEIGTWISASHDGYKHLGFPEVTRLWFLSEKPHFWCSFHLISKSSGAGDFQEFIHLHPLVQVACQHAELGDPNGFTQATLKTDEFELCFQPLGPAQTPTLKETLFSPYFGFETSKKTIVLTRKNTSGMSSSSLITAWSLSYFKDSINIILELENNTIKLKWKDQDKDLISQFNISNL